MVQNVLATRYASTAMRQIWSPQAKIRAERDFWIEVMKAQRDLGVGFGSDSPGQVIAAYQAQIDQIDLDSIRNREQVSHHDVKARIDEFNALAGYQHIHKGLTSRDLTENIEQTQVRNSMKLIQIKAIAALSRLAELALHYADQPLTGRTHNVAAQTTTLGKRFATIADELLSGYSRLEELITRYRLRGIKGPVGTGQDMLDLLGGDQDKLHQLEDRLAEHLGFSKCMTSTGQIYPRSLDFDVVSCLVQLGAPLANLATSIRLMAGNELVTEGFQEGQVGSSAMPHKMNSRSCERINGLNVVLRGYLSMVAELSASQWNEGDVACSVVRRIAMPDSFYAIDAVFETALTILVDFQAFPAVIEAELNRYLPFLMTTKILMAAVQRGIGRETAHETIKQAAVGVAENMRLGGQNTLLDDLAESSLGLSHTDLESLLSQPLQLTGAAHQQITQIVESIATIVATHPEALTYQPDPVL